MLVEVVLAMLVRPSIASAHIALVLVSMLVISSLVILPVKVLLFMMEVSLIVVVEITTSTTIIVGVLTVDVLLTILIASTMVEVIIVVVRSSVVKVVVSIEPITVLSLETSLAIVVVALAIVMVLLDTTILAMARMFGKFNFNLPLIESFFLVHVFNRCLSLFSLGEHNVCKTLQLPCLMVSDKIDRFDRTKWRKSLPQHVLSCMLWNASNVQVTAICSSRFSTHFNLLLVVFEVLIIRLLISFVLCPTSRGIVSLLSNKLWIWFLSLFDVITYLSFWNQTSLRTLLAPLLLILINID